MIIYVNCTKKTLKGDYTANQGDNQAGDWTSKERQPKVLKSKLQCNSRGTLRLESTQIRWFSLWSGGRLDLMWGGQIHPRESWKTTLGCQGALSENWHNDSLKRFNLLFLRLRRRREMNLTIKMMMMHWEPVCHKTEWQWDFVLRNFSSALSTLYIL